MDISELVGKKHSDRDTDNFLESWSDLFKNMKKPVIAAVDGFAVKVRNRPILTSFS